MMYAISWLCLRYAISSTPGSRRLNKKSHSCEEGTCQICNDVSVDSKSKSSSGVKHLNLIAFGSSFYGGWSSYLVNMIKYSIMVSPP